MIGDNLPLVLLGVAVFLGGVPLTAIAARKVARPLHEGGQVRWVYLAWAMLLAGGLVWNTTGGPGATSVGDASGNNLLRLGFLLLGMLVTAIIAAKRNLTFVGYVLKSPLVVFFVFAVWGLTTVLWSVLPVVTVYKEAEYLAVLFLVAAVVALFRAPSVAATPHEQLMRVKSLFDWHWSLLVLMMLSVYLGILIWPSLALEPSIGVLGVQLQGIFPRIATNSVGELGAIVGTVALARLLNSRAVGSRGIYVLVLAVSLTTLYLAQSRSPIIGAVLAAIVVAMASRRFVFLLGLLVLSGYVLVNYGDTTYEYLARGQDEAQIAHLSSRVDYWQGAEEAIRDRPLAGYGAYAGGRYILENEILGQEKAVSSLHNTYMETLVGTGAVGVTLLVVGLLATWVLLFRLRRQAMQDTVGRLLWIEGAGVFAILTVRSMFSTPFIWTNLLTFGLLLVYLTVLGGQRGRDLRRPHAGASPTQLLSAARR